MRKRVRLAAWIFLAASILSGCGRAKVPDVITEPALAIDRDGSVTVYLVGEFDKSYYDLSELEAAAQQEAAEYRKSVPNGEKAVTVEGVQAVPDGNGRIVLAYRFDGADSYEGFIKAQETEPLGDVLFYGTVRDALSAGYEINMPLAEAQSGETLTPEQIREQSGKHLIVTDASAVIYCPYGVGYLSEGAVLREDGGVDGNAADGVVYILLKK